MKLEEIAKSRVITLKSGDSIDRAIALMEQHDIHHLPVMNDHGPLGMVSDRDMLSAVGWLSSHDRVSSVEGGPAYIGPTRVAEIMSTPVRTLSGDDRIETAARLMLQEEISAVLLVCENRLLGIVTETDLLSCYLDPRSIAPRSGWRFHKVSDHMTNDVVTCRENDTAQAAFRLMRNKQIRHLPIVNNGKLVGIISDRDVRKAFSRRTVDNQTGDESRSIHRTDVTDIMSRDVETIGRSATLAEAADRLVNRRIGALPVTATEKLLGIITESDLLEVLLAACEL